VDKAKLEELARLHAAAKLGPMVSVHIISPGYEHCANLCTRLDGHKSDYPVAMMQAEWADVIAATYNAFPAILEYVRGLEGERDELTERMLDVQNERDEAVYFMELEGHATDHGKAWLAARDAQQRREGAAMKLLDMSLGELAWDSTDLRHEAEAMIGDETKYQSMLAEAKRLREGK